VLGARLQLDRASVTLSSNIFAFDSDGNLDEAVLPGRYEMVVFGDQGWGFSWHFADLELVAGEDEVQELVLERAVRRRIQWQLPEGETSGELTMRKPDGSLLYQDSLTTGDPFNPPRVFLHLSTGAHTAELVGGSGLVWTAQFVVRDLTPSEEAIELLWARRL
jgi:hypothetical protein